MNELYQSLMVLATIVVGKLQRQLEGTQYFVIDPADGEKIFVNSSDDMYRDANDRVWKLA